MSNSAKIAFDPYDYALQDDPFPVYARLRDEEPLHHNVEHDFWALTRHADVYAATRDEATYSNQMGVTLDASAWSPDAHQTMSFLALDPPDQTRLRKLVSKGFTPRRVAGLEERIQQMTDLALDRALEADTFDWITDLAGLVPMDVISEMLGVPESDRDEVRRLSDLLVLRQPGLRDVPEAGIEAAIELIGYYTALIRERRRKPAADLISALADAEVEGDRMTDREITAFLFLMVVAGNETTTKLLGNALVNLSRTPAQQARVFTDGNVDLIDPWIEETLRYDTSTQYLARQLTRDVTLHGVTAPAGAQLLLCPGAGNHDERVFTDPERFDLNRDKAERAQLLSFGGGRHYCLGASLARLEARVVLGTLVRRVRRIEIDHGGAERFYSANVRGFRRLPIRVQAR